MCEILGEPCFLCKNINYEKGKSEQKTLVTRVSSHYSPSSLPASVFENVRTPHRYSSPTGQIKISLAFSHPLLSKFPLIRFSPRFHAPPGPQAHSSHPSFFLQGIKKTKRSAVNYGTTRQKTDREHSLSVRVCAGQRRRVGGV